jgi:glucose/arabinose dehydrogenase
MAGRHRRDTVGASAIAAVLILAAALVLAGGDPESRAQAGGGPTLHRVGGFDAPVYVENAPGQRKLLFVVEQRGIVRVVRSGKVLRRPFLNLEREVRYGGEQGLLSIAFDPAYARNRRFYVYYVDSAGDLRVDGLRRKRRDPTRADPGSRRKVIGIPHPGFDNHNGGQLQFGRDRHLYLAPGDGGSAGDPRGNAQSRGTLLGKLLRIDPRKRGGYKTPKSNPFRGGDGRSEIYALGLRNPYRFSFDSKTGDLLVADVGQSDWEEINRVSRGNARGANFGWDLFEGNHVFEGDGREPANYRPPIHEYARRGGNCAVTGGYVVRARDLPGVRGRYLYADFCRGQIRSLDPYAQNPSATDSATGLTVDAPSSFGEGTGGRIYVTSLNGGVFRIGR